MQTTYDTCGNLFSPLSPLDFLLDIETTGLSKINDSIICIGIVCSKPSGEIGCITWFAEDKSDESLLLQKLLSFCASYKAVYTYNGKGFDIPFIISRLAVHGLADTVFKQLSFIDMKKAMSKMGTKRSLVEKGLAYQRKTTLTGKELICVYKLFESTKLIIYQTLILNHHLDELKSLRAMYEAYFMIQHLTSYQVIACVKQDTHIEMQLQTDFSLSTDWLVATEDIHLEWHRHTRLILLKVALHKGAYKKYLVPAKDYYLIEGQNQLLHKSIAQFMPKEIKHKVTQKQCFVVKEGFFIKLYTSFKVKEDLFYNEREEAFTPYQEDKALHHLILHQIGHLLLT